MKTKTIEYESPKTTVLALVNLSPPYGRIHKSLSTFIKRSI